MVNYYNYMQEIFIMTKKVFMKQAFLNDFSTEKCTFIEQIMKNNSLESIYVTICLILISLMM